MDENNSIQLFEDRKIRTAWDEEQEEWYFSVVDVIAVLTDSSNPTDYLKKMRSVHPQSPSVFRRWRRADRESRLR